MQQRTIALMKLLLSPEMEIRFGVLEWFQPLKTALTATLAQINDFKLSEASLQTLSKISFFQAPTKTILINSSNQSLTLHCHALFGKRVMATLDPTVTSIAPQPSSAHTTCPPSLSWSISFQGFHPGE